jgi:hypothetical protein
LTVESGATSANSPFTVCRKVSVKLDPVPLRVPDNDA